MNKQTLLFLSLGVLLLINMSSVYAQEDENIGMGAEVSVIVDRAPPQTESVWTAIVIIILVILVIAGVWAFKRHGGD